MAKKPTWIKSYMKLGREAFDETSLSLLTSIEKKYTEDYLKFLLELQKAFPGRNNVGVAASDLEKKVKQSIRIIQNLHGSYGGTASKKDVSVLYDLLEDIEIGIKELAEKSGASQELKVVLSHIEQQTNLSVGKISESHKKVKAAFSRIKAGKQKTPAEPGFLKEFGRGIVSGFIGETGTRMLGATGRSARTFAGRVTGGRERRERRTIAEQISPVSYPKIGGGTPYTPIGASPGGAVSKGEFDFFDRKAYKAKWTADVAETLHIIKDQSKLAGGEEKGIGGWLSKLKDSFLGETGVIGLLASFGAGLSKLVPALGVVAAGFAGFKIGEYLTKAVEEKAETAEHEELAERRRYNKINESRRKQGLPPIERPFSEKGAGESKLAWARFLGASPMMEEDRENLTGGIIPYMTGIGGGKKVPPMSKESAEIAVGIRKSEGPLAGFDQFQHGIPSAPSPKPSQADAKAMQTIDLVSRALKELNATMKQLTKRKDSQNILPIKKDSKFEADTSHTWMNSR